MHGYERFEEGGKAFIVSGGGGGPRVSYLTGTDRRHQDRYDGPAPRPFNYLLVTVGEVALDVEVRGFDRGEVELRRIERFQLPYAAL